MFNFIPKRAPSVNLLFGKRPIQRIEVGHRRNYVEIPLPVIEKIYENVNTTKEYHNRDYNPLHWKSFLNLKLNAYYLFEASKSHQTTKTALTSLDFYPKLEALYRGHLRKVKSEVMLDSQMTDGMKFNFPIQGKNI